MKALCCAVLTVTALLGQTFSTETRLVLLPFSVVRDSAFISNLKASDFVLLQDGKPRAFTVFEGPDTPHRIPLELILVFDTSTMPEGRPRGMEVTSHWNRETTYDDLVHRWNESLSAEVLGNGELDMRISVYRFDHGRMRRLTHATNDPRDLSVAFGQLLTPFPEKEAKQLALFPGRTSLGGDWTMGTPGWTLEAAAGALRDAVALQGNTRRILMLFSEGIRSGTSGTPRDLVGEAKAAGIPVYPVLLDYGKYMERQLAGGPVNDNPEPWRRIMTNFTALGEETGGAYFSPSQLSTKAIREILLSVRNEGLNQYLVGFAPDGSAAASKKHALEIKLKPGTKGKVINGQRESIY